MKIVNLDPYFTSEVDTGQARWDRAPIALKLHFAQAFAHMAGLAENPGEYDGPALEAFDEEED